jgi:RNA polymerase sigma factor (sigma-70 family)
MTEDRSAELVERWRQGDQQAAVELFRLYTDRLIALVRSRMPARLAQRVDPEDVVQSVYRSFFATAERYDLRQGGDLWRLLVTISLNKLYAQVKRNTRQKRAVGRERTFGSEDSLLGIQLDVLVRQPSPVEAVALADELEHLMGALKPLQRHVLELRLQGHTIAEIATATSRSERRIYYVLEQIKQQLERQTGTTDGPAADG